MVYIFNNLILDKETIRETDKINYNIQFKDYNKFKTIKTSQLYLKNLCKINNLNVTGTKSILKQRLYYFFKGSYYSNKIKKIWKKYIAKKIRIARGPGYINRKLCINKIDFFSLDNIINISDDQFISFQDIDNNIYGFDILSIYNLIKIDKQQTLNPFNRNKLPNILEDNINLIIKYSKILKNNILIDLEDDEIVCFKTTIIELIQHVNNLGNYVNYEWFLTLNKEQNIIFIKALYDIWNWRAQLSLTSRLEIFPPHGNPFFDINIINIRNANEKIIEGYIIKLIDRLIKTSNNQNNQILGANYILCCLTLVNENAAIAFPWLYQSVAE
jgi:hypothetical protein